MAVSFPFIVIHVSLPSMWLIAVLFVNHLRDYLWLAPIWMIAVNIASISVVTETLLFFWVVTHHCINVPLAFTFYHLCEWWLIPKYPELSSICLGIHLTDEFVLCIHLSDSCFLVVRLNDGSYVYLYIWWMTPNNEPSEWWLYHFHSLLSIFLYHQCDW